MATEPITSTTTEEDEWMMIGDDDARAALEEAVEGSYIEVKPALKKLLEDVRKIEPKQLQRKIDDQILLYRSLAHVARRLGSPGVAWTVELAVIEVEQLTSDVRAETAESSTTSSSSSKSRSIDC